jgi:hypothetical protein
MYIFTYLWPGLLARRDVQPNLKVQTSLNVQPSLNKQLSLAVQTSLEAQPSREVQPSLQVEPDFDVQANSDVQRRPKVQDGLVIPILDRLLPELIIYTARLMPLHSAAAFTLSSHYVYDLLGPGYLKSLRTQNQQEERVAFLALLERDLPHYVVCHGCQNLHDISEYQSEQIRRGFQGPTVFPMRRRCHSHRRDPIEYRYIKMGFRFDYFQLATKFYRSGVPYSGLLRWLDIHTAWL